MSKHYCFEGSIHENGVCNCQCPSCKQFKFRKRQNELNKKLSEAIRKRDDAIKESVEAAFMVAMHDKEFRESFISELKTDSEENNKTDSYSIYDEVPLKISLCEYLSEFYEKCIGIICQRK